MKNVLVVVEQSSCEERQHAAIVQRLDPELCARATSVADMVRQIRARCWATSKPLDRVDLVGHGGEGWLSMGGHGGEDPDLCLSIDRTSLLPLSWLNDEVAPGLRPIKRSTTVRLLGCGLAGYGYKTKPDLPVHGGVLGMLLARLLGCRVLLTVGPTHHGMFGPTGFVATRARGLLVQASPDHPGPARRR